MPIGNVAKRRGKAKINISSKREAATQKIMDSYSENFDVRISAIQALIPIGLGAVADELQSEFIRLTGAKYSRAGSNARWGWQDGSVYLRDQKIPIRVPRVRDVEANKEVPLEAYQRLQRPFDDNEGALRKLLHGLSTHKYAESSSLAAEVFGISPSSLSKRFKRGSARMLRQLQERSLEQHDVVAIFIDAKRYAEDGIMVAIGVTIDGKKIILGIEQIHSENSRAITQWLDGLVARKLAFEKGILFIVDGSKGITKAIRHRFGVYALIQRCRWHKRENVAAYLDKPQQAVFRRRLQDAYDKTTYKEAGADLDRLHRELENVNMSAANSLAEGLEETLTIHKLGLSPELSQSLSTTNCIEAVMSLMGSYTDKVDRWHNSNQIQRWTATACMDIEPRLNRIKGHSYLNILRHKLLEKIRENTAEKSSAPEQELIEVN